jgi:uncharacterized protein YjiS (DUF1127 family)
VSQLAAKGQSLTPAARGVICVTNFRLLRPIVLRITSVFVRIGHRAPVASPGMEVVMNMSNMSAAFIGADRALYWRDVKRLIRGRWQRARSRYELESLSDENLRDVGLTRGEAEFEASKPFWTD